MTIDAINSVGDVLKVDETLGVVFGYAIVCREKDESGTWVDHYDTQGDHIPEAEMLKAAVEFAQEAAVEKAASKDMHEGEDIQDVVLMFPVTQELVEKLGWDVPKTGLVIGLKPSPAVLEMYKSGARTGFSIGGNGTRTKAAA